MPRKSPSSTRAKLRLGARSIGLFRPLPEESGRHSPLPISGGWKRGALLKTDSDFQRAAESVELALSTKAAEL